MVVKMMMVKMTIKNYTENTEAVVYRCSSKKVFLKVLKISQKNTCVGIPF